jgi:cytochrome d ubiquinol oxidase subunit I
LIAFVVVYFFVFGAGAWYLLKLMGHTPQAHETEPPQTPIRSAGITPAPALDGAPRPAE